MQPTLRLFSKRMSYIEALFSNFINFKIGLEFKSDRINSSQTLIVPTPLVGGGIIYSNEFFGQTILVDRYIHRREM